MKKTVFENFHAFRKRKMFSLLVFLMLSGMGLKFLNLALAYYSFGEFGYLEDVAGMSLLALAREVSWEQAMSIGEAASMAVVLTAVLLVFINRLQDRGVNTSRSGLREIRRETFTCVVLFVLTFAVGSVLHPGIYFISLTHFVPLVVVSLLNPIWESRLRLARLVASTALAIVSFGLAGSKTILFYLVLALSLSHLYRGKAIVKVAILLLVAVIAYPYLNLYRSLASSSDIGNPAGLVLLALQQDISSDGVVDAIMKPYGLILDRLVGLDGLIVATTLDGMSFKNNAEISVELVGFEGVGISLGLAGQIYLFLENLYSALFIYPIAIAVLWNIISLIDATFVRLGFISVGTYLYTKAIFILIGGFSVADLKITFSALGLMLVCALVIRFLPRRRFFGNISQNFTLPLNEQPNL